LITLHREHESAPGVVESLKVITREKSERIVRFALDWALQHRRRKITCVHKANIMYDSCAFEENPLTLIMRRHICWL
jgi:isocitrate/isopropylmalate dehydrogenase